VTQSQDEFGGLTTAAQQFEATKREASGLVGGLTDGQLNHLATSTDAALPAIDRAIARARARNWRRTGPVRYGWFTRWMTGSMEPPPKRLMKTFKIFQPPAQSPRREDVLRTLSESRDRLLERVRQSGGLDVKRAIVVSPVTRLFRMPLGGYLAFLAAHDRRHLYQAQQVKATPGFGAG